jgi:hypothetical protein
VGNYRLRIARFSRKRIRDPLSNVLYSGYLRSLAAIRRE